MGSKQKSPRTSRTEQGIPWEARHENDAGGPLADNTSGIPDRSSSLPEGSPGEPNPFQGSGFQNSADAVHPAFPDAGDGGASLADDDVRLRAYQLWEEEGFPEGGHERHWHQAEREIRDGRT